MLIIHDLRYISDYPYVSKYNIQALGIILQLRHPVHLPTPISNY